MTALRLSFVVLAVALLAPELASVLDACCCILSGDQATGIDWTNGRVTVAALMFGGGMWIGLFGVMV